MAYFISRLARAIGTAFAVAMVIGILEYMYAPYNVNARYPFPYIAMALFVLITGVLLWKQYWSLLIKRVLYRAYLIFFIVFLLIFFPAFFLREQKILMIDGPVLVAVILIVSLIVTIVSFLLLKLNTDTLDYDPYSGD